MKENEEFQVVLDFHLGSLVLLCYLGVHLKKNSDSGRKSCLKLEKTCNPVFTQKNILSSISTGRLLVDFCSSQILAHSPGQCHLLDRSFGRIEVIKDGQREKGWVFLGMK